MFTHHLTQPPHQEAHTDIWGAREVELVAKSRRENKIIHVWGKSAGRSAMRRKILEFSSAIICVLLFHTVVCLR